VKSTIYYALRRRDGPVPFVEGQFDSRIEYFLELPKGKFAVLLDQSDIFRAKEILKDHACIMGNIQPSLLQLGTPDDVEEYCKKMIKVVGKGGGFILSHGSSLDEARPENVKAMLDSVKNYQP
jgi:uroporphyrinogen-III decarboxylase